MIAQKLSVISRQYSFSNEDHEEVKIVPSVHKAKVISHWNIFHVFSILAVSVVFLSPWTLIQRTNSIIYQTYWFELNFCVAILLLLVAGNEVLKMSTYFNEKSLKSVNVLLKMYLLYLTIWLVPYMIAYLIWCLLLSYNWPIPYLGYNFFITLTAFPFSFWLILPWSLRSKEEFRKNVKLYLQYSFVGLMMGGLREVVSVLFKTLPSYLQFIVAFILPILKNLDTFLQSRLLSKMSGGHDEESIVLLGFAVNAAYSFFVAVRLPGAEVLTVFFFIAVDVVIQLKMTYQIVRLENQVSTGEKKKGNNEKQKMVMKLVIAELTEGVTPVVYAIGFAMAYYGPNASILGNVKNNYWGYKQVDDATYLFLIMVLLSALDSLSLLINIGILLKLTNVNLYRQFLYVIKKYWHLIGVTFAWNMCVYFANNDINVGMDSTGEWNWINKGGRFRLIYNSSDLSIEEKSKLLTQ